MGRRYWMITMLCALILVLIRTIAHGASYPPVLINEVMPNPMGSDTDYEWIELYNGTDIDIDLTGWSIDGKVIPNETIEAHGYLIIGRNSELIKTRYNLESSIKIISIPFTLSNTTDSLELLDKEGKLIDQISYTNVTEEKSLERQGPTIDSLCTELLINQSGNSIGKANLNKNEACWIEDEPVIKENQILFSLDNITYSKSLESFGKTKIYLDYTLASTKEVQNVKWLLDDGTEFSADYEFDNYVNRIINLEVYYSDGTSEIIASNTISVYPEVILNEVGFKRIENKLSGFVELKNSNNYSVDLSNYKLIIDGIPIALVEIISQSAFLVKNFEINYEDGLVVIEIMTNDLKMSAATFNVFPEGNSYCLYKNEWLDYLPPSPNLENTKPKTIMISEIYPSPLQDENEWIEIYNFGENVVSLKNWYFIDKAGTKNLIDTENFIEPKGYFSLNVKSLNNSDEELKLYDDEGNLIDYVAYGSVSIGSSVGRRTFEVDNTSIAFTLERTNIPTRDDVNKFDVTLDENICNFTDIKEVKNLKTGSIVCFIGTVSVNKDILGEGIFYVQDSNSGIKVRYKNEKEIVISVGAKVEVKGKVATLSGQNIVDILNSEELKILESEVLSPIVISDQNLDELLNKLVFLEGNIMNNYARSMDLNTTIGLIRVSILSSTNINIPEKSKGDYVKATGILVYESGMYKVLLRFQSDLEIEPLIIKPAVKAPKVKSASVTKKTNKTVSAKPTVTTKDQNLEKDNISFSIPKNELSNYRIVFASGIILFGTYLVYYISKNYFANQNVDVFFRILGKR